MALDPDSPKGWVVMVVAGVVLAELLSLAFSATNGWWGEKDDAAVVTVR